MQVWFTVVRTGTRVITDERMKFSWRVLLQQRLHAHALKLGMGDK